jgi:hypothetical protein
MGARDRKFESCRPDQSKNDSTLPVSTFVSTSVQQGNELRQGARTAVRVYGGARFLMDKKTKGAWLVYQTGKLQRVENQGSFENTFLAGKTAILLSAISADSESKIPKAKLEALSKAAGVNTRTELPVILKQLEQRDLVESGASGIEVLGVTTAATLGHAVDVFEELGPTNSERAAIELSELASERPEDRTKLLEIISDKFSLSKADGTGLFTESEQIGFVDVERIDDSRTLYFNGNLFRREDTDKITKVLDSLTGADQIKVNEMSATLARSACITVAEAERILGKPLFTKLSSVGIYDINLLSNTQEEVAYVTRPAAFSKYGDSLVDDAFDLAKMFVSSLTYGMTRSQYARGQIRMIEALMNTLIQGEPIGPVPAIGEDYKILEMRNVVQVFQGSKGGRSGHMMRLLKKEVGVLALQVIRSADVSEHSLADLPGAAITRFSGPEANRDIKRRRQVSSNPRATNDILMALRTGK